MSAYAYDESLKTDPVSRYDFIPFVEISDNEKKRIDNSSLSADPDFHCNIFLKKSGRSKEIDLLDPTERCPSCGFVIDDTPTSISSDYFEVKLSNHLDMSKRNRLKYFINLHRTGQFEISFDVTKGNEKANDPDGYINAEITPASTRGISVSCSPANGKTLYEYGNKIKLNLKVERTDSFISSIRFYSEDNYKDNSFDWEGKVKGKIHCGEIGIILYRCICHDWPTINPVIPEDDFVGWPPSGNANCFDLAKKQIEKANCQLVESGYYANSANLFQIWKDANSDKVNDLSGDSQKKRFKECVDYLIEALNDGIPVVAGIDNRGEYYGNRDRTTDHFVTIVGMGKDNAGCYFLFYDNAVPSYHQGTSSKNKLYVDCRNYIMAVDYMANSYTFSMHANSKYIKHFVSQIRKSKKIK